MKPHQFTSISALLERLDIPEPSHPLVCVVDRVELAASASKLPGKFIFDFYIISYKTDPPSKIKYGQHYYGFDKGSMIFFAPGQVLAAEENLEHSGYSLLVHPDFFRNFPLDKQIRKFSFFSYAVHEALHLSEHEQAIVTNIFCNLETELKSEADDISQGITISYIELLLNYCHRFYKRQFVARQSTDHDLLERLEKLLNDYFDNDVGLNRGLPTVKFIAKHLHYSPRYLSDMLRSLTGASAQQHIQNMVIEKAKHILSTSSVSVAETAYQLGFGRPQSFNKLFRKATGYSPLQFRRSFQK